VQFSVNSYSCLSTLARRSLSCCSASPDLPGEGSRKEAKCGTHPRRGHLIRGIATSGRFIYEIMVVSLIITLTNLDDLLKIRGKTKRKAADLLSALTGTRTANRLSMTQRIA
jgi:hypothetical protein